MSDLVFTTRGQAEMLAAQEAVRKKALETKQELDEAAKATGAWDAATMKLKGSAESALRSISTEQEKIVDKIAKIQEAQEKGLVPPQEAEEAIKRLRQQWIDVDAATVQAKEEAEKLEAATEAVEREHARLKTTAESALRSIQTEEERILEQIEDIEAAMASGLVPPDGADEGLARLRNRLEEIRGGAEEVSGAGDKLNAIFKKAFDPTELAKFALGFVGVKTVIAQARAEFEDLQTSIDKRLAAGLKPGEKGEQLAKNAADAEKEAATARDRAQEAQAAVAAAERDARQADEAGEKQRQQKLKELDEQIAEAKHDLARDLDDYQKQLGRLERGVREAYGGGKAPTRAQQEALADFREREPGLATKRRLEDLERQRNDALFERTETVNPAVTTARIAADKATREAAEARRKAEEAARVRDEFTASPEGQRADRLRQRRDALEQERDRIYQKGDVGALSSDELQIIDDITREVGFGATRRALLNIKQRLTDGVITEDEAINEFRNLAAELRAPTQAGGNLTDKFIPATAEAKESAASLERIAKILEEARDDARRDERGLFGEAL